MGMAERIKQRRIALGFTQEELANRLGLQKSAVAKYENGRVENIKRTVIQKMADILECSPSYLMGWDDDTPSQSLPDIPKIVNQPLTAEPGNDDQQLTMRETELIDKYRNLDEYGKDVVETVASKEYDRCMADRENEIVLTPEQIRALPLQERLEAIKHDADFALVARRK